MGIRSPNLWVALNERIFLGNNSGATGGYHALRRHELTTGVWLRQRLRSPGRFGVIVEVSIDRNSFRSVR